MCMSLITKETEHLKNISLPFIFLLWKILCLIPWHIYNWIACGFCVCMCVFEVFIVFVIYSRLKPTIRSIAGKHFPPLFCMFPLHLNDDVCCCIEYILFYEIPFVGYQS